MRLFVLLASASVIVVQVHAATTATPAECVRRKIDESTELVRSSIMTNVEGMAQEHNADAHMRPFAAAIRGILDDIAFASHEMSKSTSAEDLGVSKRNAGTVLDSKSRNWTAKVDESLKNSSDTLEERKTRAASIFAIFVELGYETLLSIEKEAKACF